MSRHTCDRIYRVNPMDIDFLSYVRSHHDMGYGRMLQIIEREWYRVARARGESGDGVLVVTQCLGLLPLNEQEEWVAGYRAESLFREDEDGWLRT